jgi:ankyrin repeat protein
MIELLIANGADVHMRNENSHTALDLAVSQCHLQCAHVLLAAGVDVNHVDVVGLTSLSRAVDRGYSAMVQLLLDHGALTVLNRVTPGVCLQGCCTSATALMMCDSVDTAKVLLAAGADVITADSVGNSCLHVAVAHEHAVPLMCLLIKAGVDLHAVNNVGNTVAQIAHDKGYTH